MKMSPAEKEKERKENKKMWKGVWKVLMLFRHKRFVVWYINKMNTNNLSKLHNHSVYSKYLLQRLFFIPLYQFLFIYIFISF